MSAYWRVEMTCPRCGGELALQAAGRAADGGCYLTNVVRCGTKGCLRRWIHTQTLRSVSGAEVEVAS